MRLDRRLTMKMIGMMSAGFCLAVAPGWGNPIAIMGQPAFIAAEKLEVTVEKTAARVDGRFHFRAAASTHPIFQGLPYEVRVTIWLPASAKTGDATVREFYEAFSKDPRRKEVATQAAIAKAFDFRFIIGGKAYPMEDLDLAESSHWKKRKEYRGDWRARKGYEFVRVTIAVPKEVLAGDPEVRISYRQPLLLTKGGAEFFYVPTFDNLPKGKTTNDLNRYSMRLTAPNDAGLSLGMLKIAPGASAVLPLAEHVPIVVVTNEE